MNAVEIEAAVSDLALKLFDRAELPFAFLQAFGNTETTFKRLRWGASNKADLTPCAEDILVAREAQFPATIADLYAPASMPADLRAADEHNDGVLERIYSRRRFRSDTERLEKLFELYTRMTAAEGQLAKPRKARK